MKDYVWEHGEMSRKLRTWKNGGYATKNDWPLHPIMELQSVHLVLNTHTCDPPTKEENKKSQHGKPGNTGNDGDSSNKPGSNCGGGSPPRQSKGGHNAGRGGHGCKWDYNNDTNGGPQSQHKKACNFGSTAALAALLANQRRLPPLTVAANVMANQRRLGTPTAAVALLAKPMKPETTPVAVVAILLANLERPVMVTAAVALLANPGRPVTIALAKATVVARTGILIYDARATVDLGWSYWP